MMKENLSKSWGVDLAKFFKNASEENKYNSIGTNVGYVVSRSPLGISMFDGKILVYSDIHDIYITRTVRNRGLSQGDMVLVLSDNDNQSFFVVDHLSRY